jgi:hypothetical protein
LEPGSVLGGRFHPELPIFCNEFDAHIAKLMHPTFGGEDYTRHLVLPDFFFRISIEHAIVRHSGAKKSGKRDYLGNLTLRSCSVGVSQAIRGRKAS